MASLYKKRDIWYISSMIDNKRLSVSLRTKDKRVAKQLKPKAELRTTITIDRYSYTTKKESSLLMN